MGAGVRSAVRLALWSAALVVTLRLLLAAGGPRLSVPLTSVDALAAWTADTPPPDMAVAVLRLGAIALAGYLLTVTVLAVVARLTRWRSLGAAVERVSPGIVRRAVTGGSGIGLAIGVVVGAVPAPDVGRPAAPATVASAAAPTPDASATPGASARLTRLPDGTATMTRVDEAPPSATMRRVDRGAGPASDPGRPPTPARPAAALAAVPPTPSLPAVDPTTWVVEAGDSLWSIAAEVTALPDGSSPGERAVDHYWRRLVEANRSRLVDPANADLLVPGQHLVVPPPGG
jgi:nucleoid-associated protein YgaU